MANMWLGVVAVAAAISPLGVAQVAVVEGKNIHIEFDDGMRSRVVAVFDGHRHVLGAFSPSETIQLSTKSPDEFSLVDRKSEPCHDRLGSGSRTILTSTAGPISRVESITVYDAFPRMAVFDVAWSNKGTETLQVKGWTSQHYVIAADTTAKEPAFWSYQSGSYEKRPDWLLPLAPGFKQDNFMGMNASDYGGGTPVTDVWRRDVGIAVGHLEMNPKLVSLPVTMPDAAHATVAVEYRHDV